MTEHVRAGDPTPFRPVGAEHPAEVAEPGRTEQRVAQGMGGHVAVGMAGTAVGAFEFHAQQPTGPARLDRMDVGTETDPGDHHVARAITVSASNRSIGVVILNAIGSPSMTCTGVPICSTSDASSVTTPDPAR